jgi:hypothetical protein
MVIGIHRDYQRFKWSTILGFQPIVGGVIDSFSNLKTLTLTFDWFIALVNHPYNKRMNLFQSGIQLKSPILKAE